ncbi:hypothetical protein FE781_16775, partial [Paenibacillus thermoaerophilus]
IQNLLHYKYLLQFCSGQCHKLLSHSDIISEQLHRDIITEQQHGIVLILCRVGIFGIVIWCELRINGFCLSGRTVYRDTQQASPARSLLPDGGLMSKRR